MSAAESSLSPSEQTEYIQLKIAKDLDLYGGGVALIFGTIGNILCIGVLRRKRFRHGVATVFMIALAVVDISCLIVGQAGRHWVRALSGVDIAHDNLVYCKIWWHAVIATLGGSNWILALTSIERCIAVLAPMQAKKFLTRRNAYISLVILAVVLLAWNAHFYWTMTSVKTPTGGSLCVPDDDNYFSAHVKAWLELAVKAIAPGVIIVISNALIIATLFKAAANRNKLSAGTGTDDPRLKSTVLMLICISVAFVLLTSPIQVSWILDQAFPDNYVSSVEAANHRLRWAVNIFLAYLNNAINFLLYLISGREFRRELVQWFKELLSCCRRKASDSSQRSLDVVTPSSTISTGVLTTD